MSSWETGEVGLQLFNVEALYRLVLDEGTGPEEFERLVSVICESEEIDEGEVDVDELWCEVLADRETIREETNK